MSFKKLFKKYTPKKPTKINQQIVDFPTKAIVIYINNKFVYFDIGLKEYIKIPLQCVFSKKKLKLKDKVEIIKKEPKYQIYVANYDNKNTLKTLKNVYCL